MLHSGSYTSVYFFWILGPIKMKYGQILMCCMTNIWKLVPGPFMILLKWQYSADLTIFNSWRLPFLIVPYWPFQKYETLESWHNWLLSNWSRLLNWKGPGTYPQSSKLFKRFLKIIALAYIYQLAKFGDLIGFSSKDIFKNGPCLMY